MNTTTMPTFVKSNSAEAKQQVSRWGKTFDGRGPVNPMRPSVQPSTYRTAQQIPQPASHPLANAEFQLLIHKDYGVIGRLYSPDRKLNTSKSHRTILQSNGRTILFVSTLEDYKQLKKMCRPSNMSCNRVRTAQLLRDLENGVTHQSEVLVVSQAQQLAPQIPTQSEEEVSSLALVGQPISALPPVVEEQVEHLTISVDATVLPHQEDWDLVSLEEELSGLTMKHLRPMIAQVPGKYKGRIKKNKVVKFLAQYPEEISKLLDGLAH